MGVDLKDLVPTQQISLESMSDKTVAVDAHNAIYQFLAIIRQPDGTPLKDRSGRITSHLSGLFYRTVNLLENRIRPIYVFDGKPSDAKLATIKKRREVREEASRRFVEAYERGDFREARKYAQQTSTLKVDMVEESKTLLEALGIPWIQAPSEGEAQAAYMTRRGLCWATASQDYDALLFGSPRLVRNLTISGQRKLPGKDVKVDVVPQLIELRKVLDDLGITLDQLIAVGILVGTDYNPEGVKGVGPKTALSLVRQHGSLTKVLENLTAEFPLEPSAVSTLFEKPEVVEVGNLEWRPHDRGRLVDYLCRQHDFSEERVQRALSRLESPRATGKQEQALDSWFGKPTPSNHTVQ